MVDISKKTRDKVQHESNENRYKIVNSFRKLNSTGGEQIDVIDIEEVKQNIEPEINDYVYDLYYTQINEELSIEELISVEPANELVFDSYRDNDPEFVYESEDSNSENYYKNDYPEEESDKNSSNSDSSIVEAMKNVDIENELSSDEDFVYAVDEDDEANRHHFSYLTKNTVVSSASSTDSNTDHESDESEDHEDYEF